MPSESPTTKRRQRDARRAERRAAEAAERARAVRTKRLTFLGGGAVAVVAVIVVLVLVLGGGGGNANAGGNAGALRDVAAAKAVFAGLPERNGIIGAPSAKVTLTEFVDPQCPICARASQTTMPTVVRDYVRTGKIQLDVRTLHFIGDDSTQAALFAYGARAQGKLWPFLEILYRNQGAENSGYVTRAFLTSLATAAGLDVDQAFSDADSAAAQQSVAQADAQAQALAVQGTPSFAIAKDGGTMRLLDVDPNDPSALTRALDRALA